MNEFRSDKEILDDFYSIYWRMPIKKEFFIVSGKTNKYIRNKYGCYEKMLELYGYTPTKGSTYIVTDVVTNSKKPEIVFVGTKSDISEEFDVHPKSVSKAFTIKGRCMLWKYTIEKFEFEPIYDEDGKLKTELRRI